MYGRVYGRNPLHQWKWSLWEGQTPWRCTREVSCTLIRILSFPGFLLFGLHCCVQLCYAQGTYASFGEISMEVPEDAVKDPHWTADSSNEPPYIIRGTRGLGLSIYLVIACTSLIPWMGSRNIPDNHLPFVLHSWRYILTMLLTFLVEMMYH